MSVSGFGTWVWTSFVSGTALSSVLCFSVTLHLPQPSALNTAADIAQETFVKAWKHLPRFDARTSFRSWLFTIAKRTAIDELRKRHALPFSAIVTPNGADYAEALISDMPSPLESAHAARREAFVASAVGQLSDSHATIVRLRIVDDLTFSQISHTLGTPLNTVKSAYRRAVTQLRGFLDADDVR
jgi:RNA polymerase sigma-70 factor (ECF subfamily)